jgi:RND family efflux transporter MFP subunit
MKKKLIVSIIMAVLLAALVGTTACSATGGSSVTRQEITVTRGNLTVSASGDGQVQTSQQARLAFGSGGKIDKINVKEGDKVKTGDVLAKLDTSSLELSLKQAQMSQTQAESTLIQAQLALSTAENNLDNLENSGDSLKLALLNAQYNRDAAQVALNTGIAAVDFTTLTANLNKAQAWYDYVVRMQSQAGAAVDAWALALDRAKESLDVAQAAYDNALAGYDTNQVRLKKEQLATTELSVTLAQKNIDDLGKNIALQELQVASANQTVRQAAQALELARQSVTDAQKQLDEATITAPFDGVIAAVLVKEGDQVAPPAMTTTAVVQMVNPNSLELVIKVDEIDIPSVKLAQEADVKVDALPGMVYQGHVQAIYPVPVEEGGIVLYQVKISLDVPESAGIKIGMSASADIVSARHTNVLTVPDRAVTKNSQGQTVVQVVEANGKTQERVVVTGLDDGMTTEIVSGLNEGEKVLVEVKTKASTSGSLFGG